MFPFRGTLVHILRRASERSCGEVGALMSAGPRRWWGVSVLVTVYNTNIAMKEYVTRGEANEEEAYIDESTQRVVGKGYLATCNGLRNP